MKTKTIVTMFGMLIMIGIATHTHAWPVPDTGQAKCYNNTAEIPCPAPGETFYGQDGNYNINLPSYTKMDGSGNALPDSAASWVMVKDNVTGLIWENKTTDSSIHDGSKTFTWCDKNSATNGGNQGTCGTGKGAAATDTEAYIKAMNDANFGGSSDWRMPMQEELTSIAHRSLRAPSINAIWFPNTSPRDYWSSSTHANYFRFAWSVDFLNGIIRTGNKLVESGTPAGAYGVRAVRGGQSGSFGNLVINGDGTVTDTATGLMWQQEESVSSKTWQAALEYAEGLSLAGYDDWRLPTISELQTIIDFSRYNPAIDSTFFPGTLSYSYWSSSTNAGWSVQRAWFVSFSGAAVDVIGKTNDAAVRAVRGGQFRLSGHLVISAPLQADRLDIGQQKTLTWETAGIAGNVRITLSPQGGKPETFTKVIAESVPNNGSYAWTVTSPDCFNCALRIEPIADATKSTTQSLFSIIYSDSWITADRQDSIDKYKITLWKLEAGGTSPTSVDAAFTTSDPTVATIGADGILTALKNGYVDVSATRKGQTWQKGLFVFTTSDALESGANDTKAGANPMQISVSDPKQGRFYKGRLPEGDVDYFSFTLSSASLVDVGYLTYSATADVKIDLYDGADTLLASGTSTNGQPLMLPVGLSAGTYYLKLSAAGDVDDTNYYIVTYRIMGNLPDKVSTPILFGETKSGSLYQLSNHTDYTFQLSEPHKIKTIFTPFGGLSRYRLQILNESQAVVHQSDCLEHKKINWIFDCLPGRYTLRVTPVGDVDAGNPFTLQFLNVSQLEVEPNDQTAQATIWKTTDPMTGLLAGQTDVDFYRFTIETPRYVNLGFSSPGSTKPFRLRLYKESDQNEIDGVDVVNGQNFTIPMGLSMGTYYLKVDSADADTVSFYTLTLTDSSQTNLEIESNNTFKMANALEKGSPKKGRIYSQNDKDYFGFHLENEGEFTVTFTPSSTVADYKITLVDASDNVYDYFTSANGQSKSILFYAPASGNYYLRVTPNGDVDPSKTYDLTLTSEIGITGLKQLVSVIPYGPQTKMLPSDTQTLTATAGSSDASMTAVTPTWTSLNPAVATVNAAGLVTAIAQGTTSIVASYEGFSGKFDITVGAPANLVKQHYGNLILVGGGGYLQTNTLKAATLYLTDLVYRRFKERLFNDEDIYYFHPWPAHDLDGDSFPENIIRDTVPTVAKLGTAITQWAASQSTDGPLYIYLIDHGGQDYFVMYEDVNHNQENLTSAQLNGFINTFQTATNRQVIVVIEACKSGSFVNDLYTSGQNRIVVTSTNDQYQFLSPLGSDSFTQFFMDKLWEGDSIHTAFTKATQKLTNLGRPYNQQVPKLVNELAANSVMIGGDFPVAGAIPSFTEQSAGKTIAANSNQELFARFNAAVLGDIASVWAVVVPPVYDMTAQVLQFPKIDLTDPEKDGKYTGNYSAFTYNGEYQITFYAQTTNGNIIVSVPAVFTVTGGMSTEVPGDINGDRAVSLSDAVLAMQITAGITLPVEVILTGYTLSSGDVNADGRISLAEAIYILQKMAGVR